MSLPYLDAMLLYLDPQTRERVVRAAEDSIRAELRRVNALLTEAIRDRVAAERALDDAHVRNATEQDEHSAERARLAAEIECLQAEKSERNDDAETIVEAPRAQRDAAVARADIAMSDAAAMDSERVRLRDQIENHGCLLARLGERTYECSVSNPCGLCELRGERDSAVSDATDLRARIAEMTARLEHDTQRPPPPCTGCGIDRDGGPCSLCAAAMIGVGR